MTISARAVDFVATCRWTEVFYGWRPNLQAEGGNHIIELAVAGAAHLVVTQNLTEIRRPELKFPGLRMLAPAELLKELNP